MTPPRATGLGLGIVATLVSAPAWASPEASTPSLATPVAPLAIAGGSVDAEDRFPSVVAITAFDQRCSGVVLTPRFVLTAAHCLEGLGFGRTVTVTPGVEASPDQRIQGIEWGLHPDYCRDCDDARFDFGYIELFTALSLPDEPPRPLADREQWASRVTVGTSLELVGYGESEAGPSDPPVRQVGRVEVSARLAGGLEFEVDGDGVGPCDGDSGAPAFLLEADGTATWVGMDSRGFGCGAKAILGASVAPLCWIRDEIDVDLLPEGCEDCECVTTPQGCGCAAGPEPGSRGWGMGALLLIVARRRRPR